jgi:TP53 regulating kinase-like protein
LTKSTFRGGASGPEGRLLYRGAEADVIEGSWEGVDAIFKVRNPLRYRLPVLDEAIRRSRTIHEAQMIHSARSAGLRTPYLYAIDIPNSTLVMEYIRGERVKDVIPALQTRKVREIFRDLGRAAGSLHASGIMHGDLTTANVVYGEGELAFVDFGLAVRTRRIEDCAVDLRLIKETLSGAHPELSADALDAIYEGYSAIVGTSRFHSTLRQLQSIERRGRYARVT